MSLFSVEMEYALVQSDMDRLILAMQIIEHHTEIGTLSTGIQKIKVSYNKLLNTLKTTHEIKSTDTYIQI